ncbi:hypothetical protein MBR_09439, partial [Metarhizium brunneum ARSEF 3297]
MESTTPFKESYELGYAQIQLRNLTFPFARDKELAAVDCLAAIFKERCDPDAMENQIPVFVSPSELALILTQTPGIELETLAHGQPPFPRLKPTGNVRCLHGRQRYEAAMRNFGPEKWWSVRIFRIPEGSDPEILLLRHIDHSSHQMKLSDGDVFRHVFACRRMRQRENENYWHLHLSKDKKGALKRILEDEVMSELLYELTDYPGLRNGWQLGNIDKHFADRCPEEIYNYLRHIKETWRKITLNNSDVRMATDNETVKELTLLCPSASYADNDKVRLLMRSGKLFGSISDSHLRGQIEQQLLGIGVVIPSIETFHGNMKYLRVDQDTILRAHDLHLSSTSTPAASVEIQQQSAITDLEGLDVSYSQLGSDSAVISAAQSALNRRRMRQPQSESPPSILVPDVQQASSPSNCSSLDLTDCPLNEDGSTPSFGTPPRRTVTTSIGSQLTQDSATTGRTMISPGDIMEYMRIDKVGNM